MSIVLRESEWAEQMIASRDLGKKPVETLRRVARYYIDKGCEKEDVRKRLESFLIRCDPDLPLPKWFDRIDYAIKCAEKYTPVNIDYISISDTEMKKIDGLDGSQTKRLAFTLLCLAKYWNIVMVNGDGWVNSKDGEIMALANIKTSIKRQSLMYWYLMETGMIRFSARVDNTNVQVLFMEGGDPVMNISDFRNLGYQYLMYHGEPYFECESCGIVTKIKCGSNKRRQKYCKECATKIRIKQRVESVMRYGDGYNGIGIIDICTGNNDSQTSAESAYI